MLQIENRFGSNVEVADAAKDNGQQKVDTFSSLLEGIMDDIDSLAIKTQRLSQLVRKELPEWAAPVDGLAQWVLGLSGRVRMLTLSRDQLIKWLG